MVMYPLANILVVQVSLETSLDRKTNMEIGRALSPLRDDNILILGSGYSFHNMEAFFHTTKESVKGSNDFHEWLKDTILPPKENDFESWSPEEQIEQFDKRVKALQHWDSAPGARLSHPREEHLIPLLMVAAAAGEAAKPRLIYGTTNTETTGDDFGPMDHAVTGYLFE